MDIKTVLAKVVTLIYKSRLLESTEHDDLIRTILGTMKNDKQDFIAAGINVSMQLRDYCYALLEEKETIPSENLIQHLSILLEPVPAVLAAIKETILASHDEAANKRIVTNTVKTLTAYYKETLASEIISKVSYELKFKREKIGNFSDYLQRVIAELEPLATNVSGTKDPAVVNEVDFTSLEGVNVVLEEVKKINNKSGVYKLGWIDINTMTQGGLRRGETVTIGALQHKYKTGFSLSLFMQIALHNAPIMTKEEVINNKKPLLLRISFEDSLPLNMQFMYQYLKANEGQVQSVKDFDSISVTDMSEYIISKLTVNGFNVKMIRVDPTQWTYLSIINKVIELESLGNSIHVLALDYLTQLPTTGCTQGTLGSDKKDLLRRIRNFCSARNIILITPLQLSSEAKNMIRMGIAEYTFVNEIAEKGYYDGSKGLDQEIDLELYLHLFSHKRKKYISVRRGKHRLSTQIDDSEKFVMYRFAGKNIPILEDINSGNSSGYRKLPLDEDGGSGVLDDISL